MENDFVESLERSTRVKVIESWSEILKFLGKKFFGGFDALDIGGRFVLLKKRKVIHFNNRRRD